MDTNQEITNLKKDVANLKKFNEKLMRQQITYPLDSSSIEIIQKDFLQHDGDIKLIDQTTGTILNLLTIKINNRLYNLGVLRNLTLFIPNSSTDVMIATNHGLTASDTVILTSTGTLPAPLNDTTLYYPVSVTTDTFKLSLSLAGAAIDITTNGTGTQYVLKYL